MKKLFYFCFFLMTLSSCSKKEEAVPFDGMYYQMSYDIKKSLSPGLTGGLFYVKENEKFLEIINNIIPKNFDKQNRIIATVVYSEDKITNVKEVKVDAISYLSIYFIDDKGVLTHSLYNNTGSEYISYDFLKASTSGITTGPIQNILELLKIENKKLSSYYIIRDFSVKNIPDSPENLKIKLTYHLFKHIKRVSNAIDRDTPTGARPCPEPCPGKGCDCYVDWDPGTGELEDYCDPCVCPMRIISEHDSFPSTYESYFTFGPYEALRDSFLANYIIGQKYINYYYSLGYFLNSNNLISSSAVANTASVSPDAWEITHKILNFPSDSSDILISSGAKERIINLIDFYKTLSSNTDYNNVLDDIKSDVNLYSEKSVNVVLNEIE